jgi:hypothetical protein
MDDQPPAGVSLTIEPAPSAIAALAQHIRSTGRTYALADLAKMILLARDRFQARFQSDAPAERPLFFCPADQSLWISKEEAISHVMRGPTLQRYYQVEDVTVDPPKGNFTVVAVCGLSGRILGPPNHHEYSLNVVRLHRERFSDMSLERYKSRIEMRRDEETIEKWKAEISTRRQYRIRPEPLPIGFSEEGEAEKETLSAPEEAEAAAVVEGDAGTDSAVSPEEAPVDAESAELSEPVADEVVEAAGDEPADGDAESAEESGEAAAPAAADDSQVLKSTEAMERHFKQHFADDAIQALGVATVPGSIPGRSLSRGLLTLLKNEAEQQRRSFPLGMIQLLCRDFEKSGLRFFKRGKKALHVSVTRPRAIEDEEALSERVREIIRYIREHPRKKVVDLLDALVTDYQRPPEGESFEQHHLTEREHSVLADLRWLTLEGYIIEFPGTELVLAKIEQPQPPAKAPGGKGSKNKPKPTANAKAGAPEAEVTGEPAAEESAAEESAAEESAAEESVAEEPVAEEPVAEEPVAEEPVAEEPVAEEPAAEEPAAEEPAAEEPAAEEPAAEEPSALDSEAPQETP